MNLSARLDRIEAHSAEADFRFQVDAHDEADLKGLIEDCMLKAGLGRITIDYAMTGKPAGSLSFHLGTHEERLELLA